MCVGLEFDKRQCAVEGIVGKQKTEKITGRMWGALVKGA